MSSKGYLTIAQNGSGTDYVRAAYGLALSLKATQIGVSALSVAVEDPSTVPEEYLWAFDEVVQIPENDDARDERWKIHNKWKVNQITPYDETVLLDADMIFPTDVSDWWELLSRRTFWACTNIMGFHNKSVKVRKYKDNPYRFYWPSVLPDIYTAFMYFKKSSLTDEICHVAGIAMHNWDEFRHYYFEEQSPKKVSGDLAFATAINVLDVEEYCTLPDVEIPCFTHMKSKLFGVHDYDLSEDWTIHIDSLLRDDITLMVNTFVQRFPFHYHVKDWLTDENLAILEKAARES